MDQKIINKKKHKIGIYLLSLVFVGYPVIVWYLNSDFSISFLSQLFPLLGILAFMIMWLHVVGGAMERYLQSFFDFKKFVSDTTTVVLFLIILHPLLMLISVGSLEMAFNIYTSRLIWLAIIGFIVLISYDIAKFFKNNNWVGRNWEWFKFISVIGFFIIFFHSLSVGSDLQAGSLRIIWIVYGIVAFIATIKTYIWDKVKKPGLNP